MRFWCPGSVMPICTRSLWARKGVSECMGPNPSGPPLPRPRVLTRPSAPANPPWCPAPPSGSAECNVSCGSTPATQGRSDRGSHLSHSSWAGEGSPCGTQATSVTPEMQTGAVLGLPIPSLSPGFLKPALSLLRICSQHSSLVSEQRDYLDSVD